MDERKLEAYRRWWLPSRDEPVDRLDIEGVAIALAFLIAVTFLSWGQGDKHNPQEPPDRSHQVEFRSNATTEAAGASVTHSTSRP